MGEVDADAYSKTIKQIHRSVIEEFYPTGIKLTVPGPFPASQDGLRSGMSVWASHSSFGWLIFGLSLSVVLHLSFQTKKPGIGSSTKISRARCCVGSIQTKSKALLLYCCLVWWQSGPYEPRNLTFKLAKVALYRHRRLVSSPFRLTLALLLKV